MREVGLGGRGRLSAWPFELSESETETETETELSQSEASIGKVISLTSDE